MFLNCKVACTVYRQIKYEIFEKEEKPCNHCLFHYHCQKCIKFDLEIILNLFFISICIIIIILLKSNSN